VKTRHATAAAPERSQLSSRYWRRLDIVGSIIMVSFLYFLLVRPYLPRTQD
jgi:hypothetical protein